MTEQTGLMLQARLFDVAHYFGGGVYAKETRIAAGAILVQHKHKYSHLSILAVGEAVVTVNGVQEHFVAPACLEIPAETHHAVRAVTDVVWYCIHATDCTDPDQVDSVLVSKEQDDMNEIAQALR